MSQTNYVLNSDIETHIGTKILDCAFKVHTTLGPGLLESVYQQVLAYELRKNGLSVQAEVSLPVIYDGIEMNAGFRADMIVEGKVLVELKAQEQILPVHYKQVLTYCKLSGLRLRFLINFNIVYLKDGIKRIANGL